MEKIRVIGGGLAGCEASYQLLKRGYAVDLYEMRPTKMTPCHSTGDLAELVCSNSLKSMGDTASGALKKELELLDSLLIRCAYQAKVPAGSALAIDREKFSKLVKSELLKFENLNIIEQEFTEIDDSIPTIVASGPLTSDSLAESIALTIKSADKLHFYDAVAPIVSADSLDYSKVFQATRYGKGDCSDYLNAGMNKQEYETFYNALIQAESALLHDFDKRDFFEGCMPIEVMAKRGSETIRYGMLKPIGIINPNGNQKYYAVVQLRKENTEGSMYNLVGFQTNLIFPEQKRVFRLIPGLENAEFLRYGVMHRNTFLNSPKVLTPTFKAKTCNQIYFAGQITGVEGYVESIMSGLLAAINLDRQLRNTDEFIPPNNTISGALARHISTENNDFQPMNANFGILPSLEESIRDKKLRKSLITARCVEEMKRYINNSRI